MDEKMMQKNVHIEKIRNFVRRREAVSKSEIARETGLSFPTVTRIADRLCESGEFVELGQGDSTGGRPSVLYGLNMQFSLFLLVRIEGMEVSWRVMDLAEQSLESGIIQPESDLLETLDHLILEKEAAYPAMRAISVGMAAQVAGGVVVDSYASAEMKGINLLKHFKNLTEIPVQLHNDMNLIALGGWYRSKEKPSSSVSLYLGKTCFGAGIVLRGEVWTGVADFAGELGYLLPPFRIGAGAEGLNHIVEDYVTLIVTYAAILNPEQMVLYDNPHIRGQIDEIRCRCAACLPSKAMPGIELSDTYEADYEKGLYAMAEKIMREV